MDNIAVFCGSKNGGNPAFVRESTVLCEVLGKHHKHIIYGGGNAGLMGLVANTVLAHGGTVTGIIPAFLDSIERQHEHLTNIIVTETMHERKKLLFEKSDMAIILPGGFGTMDELFELLTWNQLDLHKIKVVVLNADGFYDHLKLHIEQMYREDFLYSQPDQQISYITTGGQIVEFL